MTLPAYGASLPKIPTISLVIVLMVAILAATRNLPAQAHHTTTKFDDKRVVRITGIVTGYRWKNPHVLIEIGPGTDAATDQHWTVELKAPSAMTREGWKRDLLALGDHVSVFANPLRKDDSAAAGRLAMYVGIILTDGNSLGCTDGTPCPVTARLR
jgi:hypothetical protein